MVDTQCGMLTHYSYPKVYSPNWSYATDKFSNEYTIIMVMDGRCYISFNINFSSALPRLTEVIKGLPKADVSNMDSGEHSLRLHTACNTVQNANTFLVRNKADGTASVYVDDADAHIAGWYKVNGSYNIDPSVREEDYGDLFEISAKPYQGDNRPFKMCQNLKKTSMNGGGWFDTKYKPTSTTRWQVDMQIAQPHPTTGYSQMGAYTFEFFMNKSGVNSQWKVNSSTSWSADVDSTKRLTWVIDAYKGRVGYISNNSVKHISTSSFSSGENVPIFLGAHTSSSGSVNYAGYEWKI